jgi:hypothetical protein
MTVTQDDIDAAKARRAAAEADVQRLEAQLADGLVAQEAHGHSARDEETTPRNGTSAGDGREEALRRYGRTNSGLAEAETDRQRAARHRREDAAQHEAAQVAQGHAEAGKAEAQRRIAARRRAA